MTRPRTGWAGQDALTLGNVKELECAKTINIKLEMVGALVIVFAHSLVPSTNMTKMASLSSGTTPLQKITMVSLTRLLKVRLTNPSRLISVNQRSTIKISKAFQGLITLQPRRRMMISQPLSLMLRMPTIKIQKKPRKKRL